MKVLLDECVDTRLAAHLVAFDTRTVHDQGWSGITNGKLLALAQVDFEVFVTVDRNLAFQQHLPKFSIAVILLHARTGRTDPGTHRGHPERQARDRHARRAMTVQIHNAAVQPE